MKLVWIALGGALGAVCRYGVNLWAVGRFGDGFPLGTLLVNVLGSLLLGFFLACQLQRGMFSPESRFFFAVGWCGSFTTFSTFSYETLHLAQEGEFSKAVWNMVVNVGSCLAGVFAGWKIIEWMGAWR